MEARSRRRKQLYASMDFEWWFASAVGADVDTVFVVVGAVITVDVDPIIVVVVVAVDVVVVNIVVVDFPFAVVLKSHFIFQPNDWLSKKTARSIFNDLTIFPEK